MSTPGAKMVLLLLWTGCVVDPTTGESIKDLSSEDPDISLSSTLLDFGTIALGETEALTVTVQNTGTGALQLVDVSVRAGGEPFTVSTPGSLALDPGSSTTFTVTFDPTTTGAVEGELRVESTDPDEGVIVLPLRGDAHGPLLVVDPDSIDLGSVAVGCSGTTTVNFANVGDADLLVDALSLEGAPSEITLEAADLPWVLAPGATTTATLHYAPLENAADGGDLRVHSTDALHPDLGVPVVGTGVIGDSATESFEQGRSEQLDVIVVTSALSDASKDDAKQMLQAYIDTLTQSGIDYHLLVADTYGCHAGNQDWLASTDDASAREADLERAVDAGVYEYYADQGFMRAKWSIWNNGAGYYLSCNTGFFRPEAHLYLLGITDGPDASASNWLSYENDFFEFKGSEELFTAHAVAPDDPGGCDRYDAGEGWSDMVDDTGGLFFSYCATDWKPYADPLSDLTPGQRTGWDLAQEPVPDTIEVVVDGDVWLDGWSYDARENRVVFDTGSVPEPESNVEITYVVAPGTCE